MSLTFVCRLEEPQPGPIQGRDEMLRRRILTEAPDVMLYRPTTPSVSSISHNEKITNIISQLCVSGFSFFLKENNVRRNATDMDVLLGTFSQQKIKTDPLHTYPERLAYDKDDYKGFLSGKKIVVPSQRFLNKILFHLKWLLFYQPQYLFDPELTTVNPFQDISDFSIADPKHYYCDLSEALNVLKYSVEDLYEISTTTIEELPKECKNRHDTYVIWYNKDQSPYPHPSLVILYKNLEKSREAIQVWREENRIMTNAMLAGTKETTTEQPSVYDWHPEENRWKPNGNEEPIVNMFRAKAEEDEYLLFFPMK
jgi:hypothetical protein